MLNIFIFIYNKLQNNTAVTFSSYPLIFLMSCSSVSHRTQWIVINIFQVMKSNVAKFNDLRWWTIISFETATETFQISYWWLCFVLTFSISTQWKTMLVFIHANDFSGIIIIIWNQQSPRFIGRSGRGKSFNLTIVLRFLPLYFVFANRN